MSAAAAERAAERRAVLLMAYGGPERLADVEPFLRDVRGGRPTPPELVAEVRARYAAIGGGSPLIAVTRAQAAALEARLNAPPISEPVHPTSPEPVPPRSPEPVEGRSPAAAERPAGPWRVFVGMRHWHPFIRQAVAEIAAAGLRRGVALCLAPQYSRMSIGAYFRSLDEALAALPAGTAPELARVPSWGDHPRFLDAVAERLEAAVRRLPAGEAVHVLFTAHSLPARIVAAGDPYDAELRATAAAGAVDWLGPAIEDEVPRLAAAGHRRLLACPVGFVADHVEVLYDLDVEARRLAEAHGAQLHRTSSLNTSPTFIAALAEVVRGALR